MKTNITSTLKYIPENKKKNFIFLIFLLIIGICFEGISFAIFIPFFELIINNDLNFFYKYNLNNYIEFDTLNINKVISLFLIFLIFIFFLKNFYLLFIFWHKNRFFKKLNTFNSVKLFNNYLELDWENYLQKSTSDMIANIQNENQKITSTINAFLELITEILVFIVIFSLLIIWNPKVVFLLLTFFGIFGIIFFFIFKKKIDYWARQIQNHESAFFKNIYNAISSFKEIKILGKKEMFVGELWERMTKGEKFRLRYETLQQSPRFFLEFISVLSMSLLTIYFIYMDMDLNNILINLGLFTVALFRIMPSSNRIIKNINDIKFGLNSVKIIDREFSNFKKKQIDNQDNIRFDKEINLENVSYFYENNSYIFKKINFKLNKNSIIGIIGESGSGKTTFIDILIGLIHPKEGNLSIDNKFINTSNIKSYQKKFGYIPQSLYLFNNTILQNVIIDEKNNSLDIKEKVIKILEKLKLKKIIDNNKEGIDTTVGENAIKMSGGQRQRLGMARLVYHNREILIFDESTNALDKKTEKEIFEYIYSLKGSKTIIISTHSLDMLYGCDKVYEINNQNLNEVKFKLK